MRRFDDAVSALAQDFGTVYTRYADDLIFSTAANDFTRESGGKLISRVHDALRGFGFLPNLAKSKISPPGSRKIVLGLLVDGSEPRLSKQYRNRLRQHLHFLTRPDVGPAKHAAAKGFSSVYGLQNHVRGLIAHATQVDPGFARNCWHQFNTIDWP